MFSYVHYALDLFAPETGLDEYTAANLLRQQLEMASWKKGLLNEFAAMCSSSSTDWLAVVNNDDFELGEFENAEMAREHVERLLAPFLT